MIRYDVNDQSKFPETHIHGSSNHNPVMGKMHVQYSPYYNYGRTHGVDEEILRGQHGKKLVDLGLELLLAGHTRRVDTEDVNSLVSDIVLMSHVLCTRLTRRFLCARHIQYQASEVG